MPHPSILLRKLQPRDLQFLIKIETDPDNLKFSGEADLPSVEALESYLNSEHDIILHDQLRLVIEFNNTLVGFVDLFDVDFTHLKASVGIIVDHEFRRKGMAVAALQELTMFALEQKIHTLWAKCQKWNTPSVNLFKKSGFQIVDEQDQFIILRQLL